MADWEFLIQKEGDRSWLPLDAPNVEILEGRYRVVARASRVNTPVVIRVIYLATQEMPPKRRVQKRASQTNETGLVAVLPFTELDAGIWELQCRSADLMSDLLGNSWQYTVRLQVQPQQTDDDWDTDDSEDFIESRETAQTAESELMQGVPNLHQTQPTWMKVITDPAALQASVDSFLELAETGDNANLSPGNVNAQPELKPITLADIARATSASEAIATTDSGDSTSPVSTPGNTPEPSGDSFRHFTLRLEQPSLVASHGQAIMVAGWVEVQLAEVAQVEESGVSAQSAAAKTANPQELKLWLRDPQTSEVISSDRQPFPNLSPPFLFTFSFTLPNRLSTHLLLGEVALYGQPLDPQAEPLAIDTQVFSITLDPTGWVASPFSEELEDETEPTQQEAGVEEPIEETAEPTATVNAIQLPSLEPLPSDQPDAPVNLELSFLLSPEEAEKRASGLYKILPPQIYQPTSAEATRRSLELPHFAVPKPPEATPEPLIDPSSEEPSHESTPVNEAVQESVDAPSMPEVELESNIEVTAEPIPDSQPSSTELGVAEAGVTFSTDSAIETEIAADQLPLVEPRTFPQPESAEIAPTSQSKLQTEDDFALEEPTPDSEPEQTEDPYLVAANQAFKALNLHDRFLSRLSSLATDMELATWFKAGNHPQQVEEICETPMPVPPQPDLQAYEIVVDDEPEAAPRRASWMPSWRQAEKISIEETTPVVEPNQPIDPIVPVPELNLVSGELVSGQSVQLRVRLPEADMNCYAKVWITDCETREVMDGPHWLVDFFPNGLDGQDAYVQLTVPFGSTAVQFEAIAFETHSQCESRKAIAMRPVVPPDLPVVTFDEFSDRL